jgi:hypothetical protein
MLGEFTMESIAGKLVYFHEQLHLIHWQTDNNSKHVAIGALYEYIQDVKDKIIEQLMGYSGKKIKLYKTLSITDATSDAVIAEMLSYSAALKDWADRNKYINVALLAAEMSGKIATTKYLLTQD